MAKLFQIIDNALVITDTVTTEREFDRPAGRWYYDLSELENNDQIVLYHANSSNTTSGAYRVGAVTNAQNGMLPGNPEFTKTSFQTFANQNLAAGFSSPGGTGGVRPEHVFTGADRAAAETARDAYFTTNPSERVAGLEILLSWGTDPNLSGVMQFWNGSAWVDLTPVLTAQEVAALLGTIGWNQFTDAQEAKVNNITVTQGVNLDTLSTNVITNNAKISYPSVDSTKVGFITVTQDVNLDTLESDLEALGSSFISFRFSDSTTGLNPGFGNLALNNANKDNATQINTSTRSITGNAMFDEYFQGIDQGIYIFIKQRGVNTSILYRVTGTSTLDGTRADIPVVRVRDQGLEFTDGATLDLHFLPNTEGMRAALGGPVSVSDEGTEITGNLTAINFIGAGVTAELSGSTVNVTITGTTGPSPSPISNDLRYGLSTQSDPALVTFSGLTDEANPTNPITISTGTTSAGQYFHIFSANSHTIQTIRDTVLDQIVYQDGASGNIFTKVANSRTENLITYDAYSIGPLNAGVDEDYVLTFTTT